MNITKILKRKVKRVLQYSAAAAGELVKLNSDPRLLILTYHRILPVNDPRALREEPGMIISPETLSLHLQLVMSRYEIVSLNDWIERKESNKPLPKRACVITFDDGWHDNYEYAFPILESLGLPATIFLTSALIGTNKHFWPERIALLLLYIASHCPDRWKDPQLEWITCVDTSYKFDSTLPSQDEISEIINAIKIYMDDEIHTRIDFLEDMLNITPDTSTPSLLNWDQVLEMVNCGIVDVGSHTCNHIRLNKLTDANVMKYEIIDSKRHIEKITGKRVSAFCFPNGDYNEQCLNMVKQHYLCALTTKRGVNSSDTDVYQLKRISLHEDSTNNKVSFLASISGLL